MGRDKALLPFPGNKQVTMLAHLAALLKACCDDTILVARTTEQAQQYAMPGVRTITDQLPGVGPLMGLYSGLSATQAEHALVIAVDMPFLEPALVAFLLSLPRSDAILVPLVDETPQVLLAIYPRSLLPTIEACLRTGQRGPRALLSVARVHYIEEAQLRRVDPQLRSFINLNTPQEWTLYNQEAPSP